jgi:hypothetical protein
MVIADGGPLSRREGRAVRDRAGVHGVLWRPRPSLRTSWPAIAVAVVASISILLVAAPSTVGADRQTPPPAAWYVASVTLSLDPTAPESPTLLQAFLQRGPVPSRVARALAGVTVDDVAERLEVASSPSGDSLRIAFSHPDPDTARTGVEHLAAELVTYLAEQRVARRDAEAATLVQRLEGLGAAVEDVSARHEASPGDSLVSAELDARRSAYVQTYSALGAVWASDTHSPALVDDDVDVVGMSSGGVVRPTSHTSAVLLGGLGAVSVAALAALVAGAVDRRLRTTADVEAATGLPVLIEIPVPRDIGPDRVEDPTSRTSAGIRTLRAVLSADAGEASRVLAIASFSQSRDVTWLASRLAATDNRVSVVTAPPLDRVESDSQTLSTADQVITVIRRGDVDVRQARRGRELLEGLDARTVGAVLLVPTVGPRRGGSPVPSSRRRWDGAS